MKFADNQVVVSLGTNHHREQNLSMALDGLAEAFGELQVASIYHSLPQLSEPSQEEIHYYLNTIVSFTVQQTPAEVQAILHKIEDQCGRDRSSLCVTMDIDFLFYGERNDDELCCTRKQALQYAYVLKPLAELFPHIIPPVNNKNFSQLWECFEGDQELHAIDFVWQQQLISVSSPCIAM